MRQEPHQPSRAASWPVAGVPYLGASPRDRPASNYTSTDVVAVVIAAQEAGIPVWQQIQAVREMASMVEPNTRRWTGYVPDWLLNINRVFNGHQAVSSGALGHKSRVGLYRACAEDEELRAGILSTFALGDASAAFAFYLAHRKRNRRFPKVAKAR